MKKRIRILVDKIRGTVEIEPTEGVKGTECIDLTKELEELMGTRVSHEKKREYYQTARQQIRN